MLFHINLIFLLCSIITIITQSHAQTTAASIGDSFKILELKLEQLEQKYKSDLDEVKSIHKKDMDEMKRNNTKLEAKLNSTNPNENSNSPCGDWDVYKDEKCFKIFDNLITEPEAEIACNNAEKGSKLATIRSSVEQQFVSNLVFKTHKIVDNVWIGAKYSIKSYKWIDNTDIGYTNWAKGMPNNSTDKACVQMMEESPLTGQWIDEPCNKHAAFICQKMQALSITHLQESINNLKNNPVPIGFIYVQLPSQLVPESIWPTLEWKDISSDYAGLFFRAEGGGSAAFETEQSDNSPRLIKVGGVWNHWDYKNHEVMNINAGETSKAIATGMDGGNGVYSLYFTLSGGEVRPRNKAIRIWKRIH